MTILKLMISPVQARILEKHRCPACTQSLNKITIRIPLTAETEMVKCKCGRHFVYNRTHRHYRRAADDGVHN